MKTLEDQSHVSRAIMCSPFFSRLFDYRFAIAAFLIPVGVRAIPELLVGPYQVGWDTIAFYVPNTIDWAFGRVSVFTMLGTAPLLYILSVAAFVSGANPIWIFKVMGPVLYGGLIWSEFRFLKTTMKWTDQYALSGALITALYFVTLRVSWDMYRNMLGLTFILLSLPLLQTSLDWRKSAVLSAFMIGAIAADQLTGVIALFLVGFEALSRLYKGSHLEFRRLVVAGVPGLALFVSMIISGPILAGHSLTQSQPVLPAGSTVESSIGFMLFAYGPLAPLAAFGFQKITSSSVKVWPIFCLAAALTTLVPFEGLFVMSYRWTLLADIPICIFAAQGLMRLAKNRNEVRFPQRLSKIISPMFMTALVLLAILYISLPAQSAMQYYTAFPALFPTSMIQDTVPASDMGSVRIAIDWASANLTQGTALITHQAIYGWARVYFDAPNRIVNYHYADPSFGVALAKAQGYSKVLLIWWVDGLGLHGQPEVPPYFIQVFRAGNICVYRADTSRIP